MNKEEAAITGGFFFIHLMVRSLLAAQGELLYLTGCNPITS
jgi:hypothetical protein